VETRKLGAGLGPVSAIGLGCMGMSEFYGPTDRAQSYETLDRALELGVTFFDTADVYGCGDNERLLSDFLRQNRADVTIATKFGIVRERGKPDMRIDTSPGYVRSAVDACLSRLGIEQIDLIYTHRLDGVTQIEDTVGAMAELVRAGKVRGIGLSEITAATLRRAHAVHPVAAVQAEYSLWAREPEQEIFPACADLRTAFVAYSPLGRGFLTGRVTSLDGLADDDYRRVQPRFDSDNLPRNMNLLKGFRQLAEQAGCTPAQLALAWVLAQDAHIIPIPGTKRRIRLEENLGALKVTLETEMLAQLDRLFPRGIAAGARYDEGGMSVVGR
jgi:aryl-alcohol dehydrogenase-like predicted oxidoreductase